MHFLAFLADTDPAWWVPLLEKWGFPTVGLVLVCWWGHKQIERLIDSHVSLNRVLSRNVVETREDVAEIKSIVTGKPRRFRVEEDTP